MKPNRVREAHEQYISHLMLKKGCCAAMHGRHCPEGQRLRARYQSRYWAGFVLEAATKSERQARLHDVPSGVLQRVKRIVAHLFRVRQNVDKGRGHGGTTQRASA